ncbi:MAG: hypothetical protein QOG34_1619 [Frankiaceae bacterium]|nr:hypothetical protein [Frankiaceae bacterium]
MDEFDAVVAGGGPAGSAAAIALARRGARVALADAGAQDARVGEALPPAVRPLLRDLGVLERFEAEGHLPSHGTTAAWGGEQLDHDFVLDPNGSGWHLDRSRFDAFLRDEAERAGATLLQGVRMRSAQRASGGWKVTAESGGARERVVLRSAALVDATGRSAALARSCGAQRQRRDHLVCVFARLAPAGCDHDARTAVEAAPDGWWYSALLPDRTRLTSHLTDSDLLPRGLRSPAGFAAALQRTQLLRSGRLVTRPRVVAAHGSVLTPPAGDGWVAVGDAALAFDPLSSQGLLNALFTGLAAADALATDTPGAYAQRLGVIERSYRRARLTYYGTERRWADRPFWARRRGA